MSPKVDFIQHDPLLNFPPFRSTRWYGAYSLADLGDDYEIDLQILAQPISRLKQDKQVEGHKSPCAGFLSIGSN
jgi:hypothetical protein